ncbi:F-box/LRR-repeat protein 20-like [Aphidius gifuensis]|uniref:F-box/LRR-repeat protein 20-like n=1 Tax=Aphidius gifuensis TaxID=684658 RepID=UPI001CDBE3A5|nr:F-box/LRR-repeat protein 20-like [Aphidius gifuensis]
MPFIGDHCKNLTSLECKFNVDSLKYDAGHFVQAFTQLNKLKCIKMTMDHNGSDETINLSALINSLPEEINEIHLFNKHLNYLNKYISMSVRRFRNLQKLTSVGFCLDNIILEEIADITTLVHLTIELYDINKKLSLFDKLVNLEYIDLIIMGRVDCVFGLTDEVLNTIFCTCKKLKHLDIPSGLYDVAKIPLEKWINFQNLQYLGICCDIMPDLANTVVEYCKNLKHLRITDYRDDLMNETALKKLTELKNLECLILEENISLSEESIIAISNNCKKLKRLEISECIIVPSIPGVRLSSSTVLDELSKLQCLEHLNLGFAENLKDSTIISIANNCKKLKILDIQGCCAITETSLVNLTNLENLVKLDVSCLDIITDSFLIKLKGLKELNCYYCQKLTNAGIIQFINNNPDLELLDVRYIKNLTSDLAIAADQATQNRTNGIILDIIMDNWSIIKASKSIIKSQWLVIQ